MSKDAYGNETAPHAFTAGSALGECKLCGHAESSSRHVAVTPKFDQRVYYLEFEGGLCGLRVARSITQANADARKQEARAPQLVRRATQADVDHVAAMGGWVPQGKVDK